MTQALSIPAWDTLTADDQARIEGLLLDPHAPSWRAECFSLGHNWFEREQPPEQLTQLGFDLALVLERDAAAVVTELLLGYAAAREARNLRQQSAHWSKRERELNGLHRIISAANSTVALETSLGTVVEIVAQVMNSEVCSMFLFDRDRVDLTLRATYGLSAGAIGQVRAHLGQGLTGLAAQMGQPIAVADVWADHRAFLDPRLDEQRYRSMLCIPIILFAGHVADHTGDRLQGVISVQTREVRGWSEEEIHFLEVVAGELAFFIANAQRYQQTDERLHQKIRELTTFQRVSAAIATTLDLQNVLNLIVEQAVILSRVDRADIYHYDHSSDHLELIASHGGEWDECLRRTIMWAIIEGHPVAVVNAYNDERLPELARLAYEKGYHSLFCIPLRVGAQVMGAIVLYANAQRYFDYEEVQLLSTFADEAAIAIENARLYREARRSLRVKDALLREMHHRVRNNLQTIGALLQMQLRRLPPETPGAAALAQSAGRIQAIATVHNLLVDEDIGVTTIQEIAHRLIESLQLVIVGEQPVQFEVIGEAVPVASREAMIVALVLNELLDNALSHGLSAVGGLVRVEAGLEAGQAIFEVRDNGPSRPAAPPQAIKPTSGLGLSIIETLVSADLEGTFHTICADGTFTARVRFPHTPPVE